MGFDDRYLHVRVGKPETNSWVRSFTIVRTEGQVSSLPNLGTSTYLPIQVGCKQLGVLIEG